MICWEPWHLTLRNEALQTWKSAIFQPPFLFLHKISLFFRFLNLSENFFWATLPADHPEETTSPKLPEHKKKTLSVKMLKMHKNAIKHLMQSMFLEHLLWRSEPSTLRAYHELVVKTQKRTTTLTTCNIPHKHVLFVNYCRSKKRL